MSFTVVLLFFAITTAFVAAATIGVNELVCAKKPSMRAPGETELYLKFSLTCGAMASVFLIFISLL